MNIKITKTVLAYNYNTLEKISGFIQSEMLLTSSSQNWIDMCKTFSKRSTEFTQARNSFPRTPAIPDEITEIALKFWTEYSPSFDTLACYP